MLSTSFLWALDPPSLTQNKQRRVRFPLMEICDAPILGITEDTDGKLWFASWGEGLYWYDGIHKGRFTYEDGLTGQFLRDCQFGPNGNLWITVDNSLMQRVGDRFLVRSDELEDVPKDFFWMELDSKGNLYVGAKDGIVAADPQGGLVYHSLGQIFPASSYVYCLFADESRGILWTGWANGFLVALDLKSFKPLSEFPPEDLSRYGSILDLTLDTEGDLWVAAEENTLVRQGDSWKEIRPQEIKEVWRCQSLCPHSKGRMLMGLALGMGDYDQGKLTIFDHNRQLSQDRVYSVYASRSDTIWLGTQSGVTCLMPPYFEREDIPISTNRLMDTDLDREGRLWVGGDGLCYRQGGVWSRVEVGDIPSKSYLSKITITPEGRVLTVWNYAGVYIWENGEGRWLPAPPHPDQAFSAVIETSDGMIWVGTYEEGVIGWNGQEWIPMPGGDREFQGQGQLDGRSVHSFCESRDGSLWIGSTGSEESLFRYSKGELELIRGPIDLTFPEIEEMIEEPDGTLVMATNGGGVLEYHNGQWAVHNRETQGFLTNRFISLEYSESEGLWAGTRSDGLYHYKNGVWTHFSGDDGLFKCRVDGLSWDENGDLFLATHLEGFLRLIRDTRPPDTFITSTPDKVIKGENVVLAVKGADPWMETQPDRLSFLWSLNQGPWRVNPGGQTLSVPIDRVGDHEIRVASVDINGNVDPIPAVAHFQAAYHWSNHPATIVVFFTSLIILGWSVIFFSVRYKYLKEAHQADLKYREKLEREVSLQTRALRQSDQFKEKLITNVSHDFRTPLTNLIGYTQLLESQRFGDLTSRQLEIVHVIQNNARRMKHLIENVAQFVRGKKNYPHYQKQRIDLKEVVISAFQDHMLSASSQDLDFDIICRDEDYIVEGNENLIFRLLDNLLSNAIKFTNPGGKVTLRIEKGDNGVILSVEDTGIGIEEGDLPKIFERFMQAHRGERDHLGGLGIGLSICKEIADFHEARIEVDSTPGKGSTFRVIWRAGSIPEVVELQSEGVSD